MSALPAWKRALLEKKKQQEQQEEQKKQEEQEAYIKSLPPWKRAIVMRELEKKRATPSSGLATGNAPTNPSPGKDKWLAALSQTGKPSPTAESSVRSSAALGGSSGVRTPLRTGTPLTSSQTKSVESPQRSKRSWARTDSPSSSSHKPVLSSRSFSPGDAPKPPLASSSFSPGDAPSPRSARGSTHRGSVQTLADQFLKVSSTPTVSTTQQQEKEEQPTQQASTPAAAATATAPAQVDDADLAGLPSWKRAIILKKRQKLVGIDVQSSQGELSHKQTSSVSSSTSADHDEPDCAPQVEESSPKAKSKKTSGKTSKKSMPEVVNRIEDDDSSGGNKLVEKEGKTLHPPIFNEVNQWANVTTDDPKFTQLPQWKQALILRRRKDIAKRSGQETSPPDSPSIQTASEKRKTGSKKATNKSVVKSEGKKSSTKTKTKTEEKKTSTKSKTKPAEKQPSKSTKAALTGNAKTNVNSHSLTGRHGGTGRLRPVRPAPVRPAPTKPPEKKTKKEEKEEPMFTWSFSKHSVETGDALSNSSDSELEDVQVTSIDDELSDEDDSGIGCSGGTVLMSYKPLAEPEEAKRESQANTTTPDHTMSISTSDPQINSSMTRSDSKSILIDSSKKSYKVIEVVIQGCRVRRLYK